MHNLTKKEKIDFVAINIVYETSYAESVPVNCYFTNEIHQAYRSYVGRLDKGKERISNRAVKQCHYCQNLFCKK